MFTSIQNVNFVYLKDHMKNLFVKKFCFEEKKSKNLLTVLSLIASKLFTKIVTKDRKTII